jgi:hypothetical protein
MQWLGKYVLAHKYACNNKLLETVFSMQPMPKLWSRVPQYPKPTMTVLVKASSNLPYQLTISQSSCETEKYGSWVAQDPKPRMTVLAKTSGILPHRHYSRVVRQKNMFIGLAEPRTNNDCTYRGQQQINALLGPTVSA